MAEPVTIQNLQKTFPGGVRALDKVSLQIQAGELWNYRPGTPGTYIAAALGVWAMAFLAATIIGCSLLLGRKMGAIFRI